MPDVYICPYGCKTSYPITTLNGWKKHMSRKHGRYSNAELEAAAKSTVTDDVKTRMEQFASELDGVPIEIQADGSVKEKPVQPEVLPTGATEPSGTRKVRATPKHLTRILSGIPEGILEALQITPDSEDKRALEEASDFLQDIFGVDFEVDQKKTTVRSRGLAFLWVGGLIGLVYVKHNIAKWFTPAPPESAFPETKDDAPN